MSGIYRVFRGDRIDDTATSSSAPLANDSKAIRLQAHGTRAIISAAHFSLISAANIGFGAITPAEWIRRLQGRDCSFEAVGWVRTVSGFQALASVALLLRGLYAYFGILPKL